MNRFTTLFLTAFLLAGSAVADHGWGVCATYWSPDDGTDEFGIGAKFGIEMVEAVLLDFRAAWFGDMGAETGGADIDLEVIPMELGLSLVFPVVGRCAGFVGGGIGYYITDAEVLSAAGLRTDLDSSDEIGMYGAAGLEMTMHSDNADLGGTRATVFVEMMYRSVEIDNAGTGLAGKASLDGFGANVGLMLRW